MGFERLIFDVSGTLWDDSLQVAQSNVLVLNDLGFAHFDDINRFGKDNGRKITAELLKKYLLGSCVEMFRSFGDLPQEDSELTNMYVNQLENSSKTHPANLYNGIEEMLHRVSSAYGKENMHVISAHPHTRLDKDFYRLDLFKYFNTIQGGVHNKVESIKELSSDLENRCVYIGDTKSDMIAANNAGVYSLGVSYGYQKPKMLREGNPKLVRASPQTLGKFLYENCW